jgi:hypothetical protein
MSDNHAPVDEGSYAPLANTLELVKKAASEGAQDARKAAGQAIEKTKTFLCRFTYTTSYTISYGVVFPAMLLAYSVPKDNVFARGFRDGAAAARKKLDEMFPVTGTSSSSHEIGEGKILIASS